MRRFLLSASVALTALVVFPATALAAHNFANHDEFNNTAVSCAEPVVMVDLTAGLEGGDDLSVTIGPYDVNSDGVNDLIDTVWVKSGSQAVTNVVFSADNTTATITSTQGISH